MNLRRVRDKQPLHTSSLISKIKEEFIKREGVPAQQDTPSPNTIKFYLNYEQLNGKRKSETEDNNVEMNIRRLSFPKMLEDKHKQVAEELTQPKKVSVNFDCFNPKKKLKQDSSQKKVHPFEEVWNEEKNKYIQRLQRQSRRRSEKSRQGNPFGLNIKTMTTQHKSVKQVRSLPNRPPKRSGSQVPSPQLVKDTPMFHTRPKKIHTFTELPLTKTSTQKQHRIPVSIKDKHQSKEKVTIKQRISQMILSANGILRNYGCRIVKSQQDARFRFFVGKGNNRNLIVSVLKKRWWWTETNDINNAHFVWTQLKHRPSIKRQTKMSQIQPASNISTQRRHSESNPEIINKGEASPRPAHQGALVQLKKLLAQGQKDLSLPSFSQPLCLHNHYQHNQMLGNKNALFQNLSSYFDFKSQDVYSIIPLTFFVSGPDSKSFQSFVQKSKQHKNAIWVVKPGQNSNRGNGIFVSRSVEDISRRLSRRRNKKSFIIQKYITNLLLYQRRKFDIRTYMLMVTIGGVTKFYWYNQGYIRTSSQIFDLRDLSDSYIHLTNDAIQINSDSYGKFEDGNKITYNQFQRYLDLNHTQERLSMKDLDVKMREVARTTVKATYNKIDPNRKAFGLQLFGLDFIVDSQFKPWLIEVNTNPCIQLGTPVMARIIPRMLQNMFRMAVDPVFQASMDSSKNTSYYIYENCMDTNRFTLIFDSLTDRDVEWQLCVKSQRRKEYEDDVTVFGGEGDEQHAGQ